MTINRLSPDRRAVVRAAAWTAPVLTIAAAAPSAAASTAPTGPTATLTAKDNVLRIFLTNGPDAIPVGALSLFVVINDYYRGATSVTVDGWQVTAQGLQLGQGYLTNTSLIPPGGSIDNQLTADARVAFASFSLGGNQLTYVVG